MIHPIMPAIRTFIHCKKRLSVVYIKQRQYFTEKAAYMMEKMVIPIFNSKELNRFVREKDNVRKIAHI